MNIQLHPEMKIRLQPEMNVQLHVEMNVELYSKMNVASCLEMNDASFSFLVNVFVRSTGNYDGCYVEMMEVNQNGDDDYDDEYYLEHGDDGDDDDDDVDDVSCYEDSGSGQSVMITHHRGRNPEKHTQNTLKKQNSLFFFFSLTSREYFFC